MNWCRLASNVAVARCAGNRAVSDGYIEPARKANVAGFAFALSRLNCADCAGFSVSDVPCMSRVSDLSISENARIISYFLVAEDGFEPPTHGL
jgi:hypothetical protein